MNPARPRPALRVRAFTLIELVLVMTLLCAVTAFAAPRLVGFLQGRDVTEEGRRILSLVRWARSEAIARGERMEIWFSPDQAKYGARPADETGNTTSQTPLEFTCDDGLVLHAALDAINDHNQVTILFWSDGTLDETSAERIELWEEERPSLALVRNTASTDYAIEELNGESSLQ